MRRRTTALLTIPAGAVCGWLAGDIGATNRMEHEVRTRRGAGLGAGVGVLVGALAVSPRLLGAGSQTTTHPAERKDQV